MYPITHIRRRLVKHENQPGRSLEEQGSAEASWLRRLGPLRWVRVRASIPKTTAAHSATRYAQASSPTSFRRGIGVLRLRRTIRFAHRPAALRMTLSLGSSAKEGKNAWKCAPFLGRAPRALASCGRPPGDRGRLGLAVWDKKKAPLALRERSWGRKTL